MNLQWRTREPAPALQWSLWLLLSSLFLTPCSGAAGAAQPAVSPDQVVDRLQSRYEGLSSFSADFVQIYESHEERFEERGRMLMKKPSQMYWEYNEPTRKIFVADGRKAYFYVPEERQVMISDWTETPLLFLLGKADIRTDFEVSFELEEEPLQPGSQLLRLEPRQPTGEYSRILVEVDAKTSLIHRLTVVEPIGRRNHYVVSNFVENARVPDRQFKFKIPKGVEVIRQ